MTPPSIPTPLVAADEALAAITADDLREAESYGSLGPEYFASRRVVEAFMAKYEAEAFKPLIDKFVEEFRDRLWSDVVDYLLSDTEENLHSAVRRMVRDSVQALLTGEEWAMRRYPFADYSDGEKVRKAVAVHGGDELALARIGDLEKEIASLKQQLEWARRA